MVQGKSITFAEAFTDLTGMVAAAKKSSHLSEGTLLELLKVQLVYGPQTAIPGESEQINVERITGSPDAEEQTTENTDGDNGPDDGPTRLN